MAKIASSDRTLSLLPQTRTQPAVKLASTRASAARPVGYSGQSSFEAAPARQPVVLAPPPGQSCGGPTGAGQDGQNLSRDALFALTDSAAAQYDLPPEVLRAIALQESDGVQWDANGNPVRNDNSNGTTDWGVMQLNTDGWLGDGLDVSRAQSDEAYNVEMGAKELRVASDHWFTQKYGHPFTMDWYNSLPADQQKEARIDLFRSYNGWLDDTSNATPYESRIESGEIGQAGSPNAARARNVLPPASSAAPAPSSAPTLNIPQANLTRGDVSPEVEQLQKDLVSLGYMTQEEMDTGPGTFGPRTQAALAAFQADHGIDSDGSAYGPQTRAAMQQVQPSGTGSAAGSGSTQGTGAASGTASSAGTGAAMASGDARARNTFSPSTGTGGTGDITTIDQANAYFTNQWAGGSQFNTETGEFYGYSDCGPTSTLIIAASLGLTDAPNPSTAEDQIDHVRDLALGYDSTESQGTNEGQMATAIAAMHGTSEYLDMSLDQVDQALASGQRVLIAGDPWGAWGAQMNANGEYLNHQDPGAHFVAILGKTADGQYLVADPLSATGVIAVSGEQIQEFWNEGGDNSGAMAVGR